MQITLSEVGKSNLSGDCVDVNKAHFMVLNKLRRLPSNDEMVHAISDGKKEFLLRW